MTLEVQGRELPGLVPKNATGRSRHLQVLLLISLAACAALLFTSAAHAATLVELGKFGAAAGAAGGQTQNGYGVAVNRTGAGGVEPGTVYLAEWRNKRVQAFSKDGAFVSAWGKDVDATEPGTGFEVCTAASAHICQAGAESAEAGALANPKGIAIDQSTGNVYVTDANNERVSVYSAAGAFQGAFGWEVKAGAEAADELQFCTAAGTGCQVGQPTADAGGFGEEFLDPQIAIDPQDGDIWLGASSNTGRSSDRINEFGPELTGGTVTGITFVRALGWNVNETAPAEELQECTLLTGCKAGTTGSGIGQLGDVFGLAVDSSGAIYVSSGNPIREPTRVMKLKPDELQGELFGPDSGGDTNCQLNPSGQGSEGRRAYGIATEPSNDHVFIASRTSPMSTEICELDHEGDLLGRSPRAPYSATSEAVGLAVGTEGRIYLHTSTETGPTAPSPVAIFGFVPAAPAKVDSPSLITATTATLNGEVTVPEPGGTGFDVAYFFEYSADNGINWLRAPLNDAHLGTTVPGTYPVHQAVENLQPNTTYRVRIVTSTSFNTTSDEGTFTTSASPPGVEEVRARDATQTTATLEGKINPNRNATTYRIEWGPTTSYGHVAPTDLPSGFEPSVGSGNAPVLVSAQISGLSPAASYHYRIVARNGAGTTTTPDHELEALDKCDLPDGRCLELVSPRDPGPVAAPGRSTVAREIIFQASDNPGSLAYEVEAGLPTATRGGEILYGATREPSGGWTSGQLSPGITERTEAKGSTSPSQFYGLSPDLKCGVLGSTQPLTPDPAARLIIEAGGGNLYRWNAGGSYALITTVPPETLQAVAAALSEEFDLIGLSADCGHVVFSTKQHYSGIPCTGTVRLYEWDERTGIRCVGFVPSASGETAVEAIPGAEPLNQRGNRFNAVSADGSRVFFTAKRAIGINAGEVGKLGVFVRENGTHTVDISQSETTIPDTEAIFQGATPDGTRAYFTAPAGITSETSREGTDLYEYNVASHHLTDISVNHDAGGAAVGAQNRNGSYGALVGVANDGSHVYFIARGQLVPSQGRTYHQNTDANSYSLYDESVGGVRFVGTIGGAADELENVTLGVQPKATSRVSPDGRYLLFESSEAVTGYISGGAPEAYLYDSAAPSEAVVCVSCRQDGAPSVNDATTQPLAAAEFGNRRYSVQSLVFHHGRPSVFFVSKDALATNAVQGSGNIYEWVHGQVFHVATESIGNSVPAAKAAVRFAGASADGTDLYFFDGAALNWENPQGRYAAWDARIGGGVPEPPPPPPGCQPGSEGSCQGGGTQPPSAPTVGSSTFTGPGNVKPKAADKKHHKKKHHKKKHHKKKHHKKKHHKKKAQKKHAGNKRRAAK